MTAPYSKPMTTTLRGLADHIQQFALFEEVKERVEAKLTALEREGRILGYTLSARPAEDVLRVEMVVPLEQYRQTRFALTDEVRPLGVEDRVLVDAFVTFADPEERED